MRNVFAAFAIVACAAAQAAVPPIGDYIPRGWYAVEVIVFERPAVVEENSRERLAAHPQPPYPARFTALMADAPGAGLALDPFTLATLRFPILERLPPEPEEPEELEEGAPGLDPGDVALATDLESSTTGAPAESGADAAAVEPPAAPVPPANPNTLWLDAVDAFAKRLEAHALKWRAREELGLRAIARRLDGRDAYRVLVHGGWLQSVPAREEAVPLLAQFGPLGDGTYELDGTFGVTLGRYLHFNASLAFREAPPEGLRGVDEAAGALDPFAERDAANVILISESRRMRSGELHYLDHPKLGVIVRIDPAAPDVELLEAYRRFEQSFQ